MVGAEVTLQPAEERVRGRLRGGRAARQVAEGAAQLARVAAERPEQRVVDEVGGGVEGAGHLTLAGDRCERVPQDGGRLRQPQVDVAQLAERGQEGHLGLRQPRVPEEGQPRRQVEVAPAGAQPRHGLRVAYVRGRRVDDVEQAPPQGGLPAQVTVELAARAVRPASLPPLGEQLRALDGVGREEAGQPAGDGVAPGRPLVGRVTAAEVGGEVLEAGRAHHVVDHLEQRPRQPVGAPRVLGVAVEQHRDERVGRHEVDARADAVAATRTHAEAVRQPLGQPALDAAGGHDHDLAGERVGQRGDQQVREAVGERVGALGGVEVQGHGATL